MAVAAAEARARCTGETNQVVSSYDGLAHDDGVARSPLADERRAPEVDELRRRGVDAPAVGVRRRGLGGCSLSRGDDGSSVHLWRGQPAQGKDALINEQGVSIPTLPVFNQTHAEHEDEHVSHVYASSYTCQTGHGMSEAGVDGSDHVLPHWPTEMSIAEIELRRSPAVGPGWTG